MNPASATPEIHHHEDALDHLEEEIKHLEGVSRWKGPVGIIILLIAVAAVIGGIAWFVSSPPPVTSARTSYLPSTGNAIDVIEPKGATLSEPPTRLAWEHVTGRLQYVVRVYAKGSTSPLFERMTTAPSIDLSPDDRARLARGNTFVWTVVAQAKDGSTLGAGQSTFRVK